MSIDISSLSAKELDSLISQAKKRKTTLNKRKPIALVRKKLTQLAKAEGYSIAELFGGGGGSSVAKAPAAARSRKPRKALGKVAAKYRNPANPGETWSGRGKQPRWMAAYTATGRKPEDFLIK
ncbi:H-NS family nucleoid-associated regulatory protein [Lysobacter niastensis]|uniref:H-NS histone family protein n=1 Tax=Lysobacter niastensis TaxID=380629 RepID=A0ABS0BE46_9GAMM|nr:H-NS histone family protein [Lysobacter niastensis]MBF6025954.1 H-NS histone family protein [Lysobacter niastensis]